MQPVAPTQHRLSWFPVHPSWIVSAGFALIAVLPHQTPRYIYTALRSKLGAGLFAILSLYVFWNIPVLGMAMCIFLVSLQINTYVEHFSSTNLSKEKVTTKHRWFQEEVLLEEPTAIQDRTDSPGILTDEIDANTHHWVSEHIMGETPTEIQEKPVGAPYAQETSYSEQPTISHK
jgi:hypothetical protein